MKRISIIALPRALGSSITIPLEMLSAANDIAISRRQPDKVNAIDLISTGKQGVELVGGMQVNCNATTRSKADLIFIPSIWRKPRQVVLAHPELTRWLCQQHQAGAIICAIANGAFFAAEAGLLDDKPATTHWRYFNEFSAHYPAVKLQRKRFTTRAERVYCTGSVNAIRDIMLHFVSELYDSGIATEIARHFTHELKPSFESELLSRDQKSTHDDELIIAVQEWLLNHFHMDIAMPDVASRFGLSIRSLNRRFKRAAGTTPLHYLQELRLEHAKQLLKQSNLVIAEVADAVGYQDASYFTELFRKANALTPNEYRELVRNKVFAAETKRPG